MILEIYSALFAGPFFAVRAIPQLLIGAENCGAVGYLLNLLVALIVAGIGWLIWHPLGILWGIIGMIAIVMRAGADLSAVRYGR